MTTQKFHINRIVTTTLTEAEFTAAVDSLGTFEQVAAPATPKAPIVDPKYAALRAEFVAVAGETYVHFKGF
jgi:hypothetical protein